LLVFGGYTYYRLDGNFHGYSFSPIHLCPKLYYLDVVFCIPILFSLTLLVITSIIHRNVISNLDKFPSVLHDDAEILDRNNDKLNRRFSAKDLAEQIAGLKHKKSFAIGITGTWGSGKTSFLKLIESELLEIEKQSHCDLFVKIAFNPWLNNSPENIISDFFVLLKNELGKLTPISWDIAEYGNKLSNLNDNLIYKFIKDIYFLFKRESSVEDEYMALNNKIKKIPQKIIVLIDDLDRLDKKEVIETIRLIRNTASFEKFVFIVAFDKGYVLNAVKEINDFNYSNYLEKVFQLEIPLVPPSMDNIVGIILERLNPNSDKNSPFSENDRNDLKSIFRSHRLVISQYINTIRDVTRLINTLALNYPKVKNEINFKDFVLVELIKLKYVEIHKLLYTKREYFFIEETDSKNLLHIYKLREQSNDGKDNANFSALVKGRDLITPEPFVKYIKEHHKELHVKSSEIDGINYIIEYLFGKDSRKPTFSITANDENEDLKRVYFKDRFPIYFLYEVTGSILEEGEFREEIRKPFNNNTRQKFITWIIQGKYLDFKLKLDNWVPIDKSEFEKRLNILHDLMIYEYSSKIGTSFKDLLSKTLLEYKANIQTFYNGESDGHKQFLNTLFSSSYHPSLVDSHFIMEILRKHIDCERNEIEFDFIMSKTELQAILLGYLQKHINNSGEVNNLLFALQFRCIETIEGTTRIIRLMPEAIRLFKEFVMSHPVSYFKELIIEAYQPYDGTCKIRPFTNETFKEENDLDDGLTTFKRFLSDSLQRFPNSEEIKEFKEFFDRLESKYNEIKVSNPASSIWETQINRIKS
jgi:hypothetical protein